MKTRKITFEVGIADSFHLEFRGQWPVPSYDFESIDVDIEFEWDEKEDVMKLAAKELKKHMKTHYGGKDYRYYYWWWRD